MSLFCRGVGHVAGAPETRVSADGRHLVTSFQFAVEKPFKRQPDYITVVAFNKTAEFVENHVDVGCLLVCDGYMEWREFRQPLENGQRGKWELQASNIKLLRRPISHDLRHFLGGLWGRMEESPVLKPFIGQIQGLVEQLLTERSRGPERQGEMPQNGGEAPAPEPTPAGAAAAAGAAAGGADPLND